jgi:hypothetical protein
MVQIRLAIPLVNATALVTKTLYVFAQTALQFALIVHLVSNF